MAGPSRFEGYTVGVDPYVSDFPFDLSGEQWYTIQNESDGPTQVNPATAFERLKDPGGSASRPGVVEIGDSSDSTKWRFIPGPDAGSIYIQNESVRLADGDGETLPEFVGRGLYTPTAQWNFEAVSAANEEYCITSNGPELPRMCSTLTPEPAMTAGGANGPWTRWEIVEAETPEVPGFTLDHFSGFLLSATGAGVRTVSGETTGETVILERSNINDTWFVLKNRHTHSYLAASEVGGDQNPLLLEETGFSIRSQWRIVEAVGGASGQVYIENRAFPEFSRLFPWPVVAPDLRNSDWDWEQLRWEFNPAP